MTRHEWTKTIFTDLIKKVERENFEEDLSNIFQAYGIGKSSCRLLMEIFQIYLSITRDLSLERFVKWADQSFALNRNEIEKCLKTSFSFSWKINE